MLRILLAPIFRIARPPHVADNSIPYPGVDHSIIPALDKDLNPTFTGSGDVSKYCGVNKNVLHNINRIFMNCSMRQENRIFL